MSEEETAARLSSSASPHWLEKHCWPTPALSAWLPWCGRLWCLKRRQHRRRATFRGSGRRSWRSSRARNPLSPDLGGSQGCSTLSTDAPLQKGIKALQSRGVSVLTEGTSLVST